MYMFLLWMSTRRKHASSFFNKSVHTSKVISVVRGIETEAERVLNRISAVLPQSI